MLNDSEIGQEETKGTQTERRILNAADALFAERGFEVASLPRDRSRSRNTAARALRLFRK